VQSCAQAVVQSGARKATANVIDVVRRYDEYRKAGDKDRQALSLKYSETVMQAAGILPSHTQSTFIQQIFAAGDVHVSQELSQLQGYLDSQLSPIIDVTPESDPSDNCSDSETM